MSRPKLAPKIELVLKALNISRARLSADLSVDKSLVSRWLSGAITPSAHNLSRLTAYIATRSAGFNELSWDLDLAGLSQAMGIEPRDPNPDTQKTYLTLAVPTQAVDAARRRSPAYEGIWRIICLDAFASQPNALIRIHSLIRVSANGLIEIITKLFGAQVEGWGLIQGHQLYFSAIDPTGSIQSGIFSGAAGPKGGRMSGILLFCRPGMGGAPIALPCISERVADLTGDAEVDEAVLHDLAQLNPFLGSADVSPEIFAHLHPNVGPNSAAAGGDIALIVPYMRAVEQGMIMEGSPVGS